MVRAKPKKYLSETEKEGLEDHKRELEQSLREAEGFGSGGPGEEFDKSKVRAEIARLDKELHENTAPTARGAQKDKLVKEEAEIEDQLRIDMPTRFEMRKPSMNPGAVRKHLNWNHKNQFLIERYRQIQQILRPTNPKSVETLREDK